VTVLFFRRLWTKVHGILGGDNSQFPAPFLVVYTLFLLEDIRIISLDQMYSFWLPFISGEMTGKKLGS